MLEQLQHLQGGVVVHDQLELPQKSVDNLKEKKNTEKKKKNSERDQPGARSQQNADILRLVDRRVFLPRQNPVVCTLENINTNEERLQTPVRDTKTVFVVQRRV